MLKQETGPMQKEMTQMTMFDSVSQSNVDADVRENEQKPGSFFGIPNLFVGLNPKGLSEYDSVISPTSPLDFRLFWGAGNAAVRSPMEGNRKNQDWDYSKVGLSIIGSIDDEDRNVCGRILRSSNNINFPPGSQKRADDASFMANSEVFEKPKSKVVFEIGFNSPETELLGKTRPNSLNSCSASPKSSGLTSKLMIVGPCNDIIGCSPASVMTKEDYTCDTSHGPISETAQTYGDCILGCQINEPSSFADKFGKKHLVSTPVLHFHTDFLSFCHACSKPLDDGKDIYMYSGEKAFCSPECREKQILFDEGTQQTGSSKSELESGQG